MPAGAAGATHDRGDGPTHAGDGPPVRSSSRRGRTAVIALLVLVACAVPAAVILNANSSSNSSSTQPQNADDAAGQKVTAELAPVPTNHVKGAGDAVLRLDGTEATVSIDASGLLDAPARHAHPCRGAGPCPPASAAARARRAPLDQHR